MQILERGGETLESARFQKGTKPEFQPRAVTERVVTPAPFAQRSGDAIALLVLGAEPGDRGLAHRINMPDEIANAVAVHRKSETRFRGDLVPLGHGHLPHVIAEPREFAALPVMPGLRRAHPDGHPVLRFEGRTTPLTTTLRLSRRRV